MSTAFVPGLIRRIDISSSSAGPNICSASLGKETSTVGDWGPIWTSVNGGGLGKRGGSAAAVAMVCQ